MYTGYRVYGNSFEKCIYYYLSNRKKKLTFFLRF